MSDYNTPNMNDFNQPLSEEITPPKKSSLIVYYVVLTFSLILVLIGLTSTIIIGAVGFAILVITFPYTIKTYIDIKKIQLNKKSPSTKKKIYAFIFLLYCVFVIGSFTSFFDCYFKFPYDLQKAYITNLRTLILVGFQKIYQNLLHYIKRVFHQVFYNQQAISI